MSARNKHIAKQQGYRYLKTRRNVRYFLRQMKAEANFEDATSSAGAGGPAQIMPGTAAGWGVRNVHDPREAYAAAAKHMAEYLKQTHGSWAGALQMYNLGHVSSSPPAETRNYIAKILGGHDVKAGSLSGKAEGGGGGGKTGSKWNVKLGQESTFDQAGFDKAKRLALVGQLIAKHHGTNSVLFKTGVLSTSMPSMSDFAGSKLTSKIEKTPVAGGAAKASGKGSNPRSVKGTAVFEGKRIAAWIKPYLVFARKHGWKGSITSGYRSFADQTRIYNSGVRPAAKPGSSNHEGSDFPRGAIDVSDAATLDRILRRYPGKRKLIYAGSKDPVHFSFPHNGSY